MFGYLIDEAGTVVELSVSLEGYSRGFEQMRHVHETLDGRQFRYSVGSFYKASLPVDFVSDGTRQQILQWWQARTPLHYETLNHPMSYGNLVHNGNAELDEEWGGWWSRSTDNPFEGAACWVSSVRTGATSSHGSSDLIPVDRDRFYRISMRYRHSNVNTVTLNVGLELYDEHRQRLLGHQLFRFMSCYDTALYNGLPSSHQYCDVVPAQSVWSGSTVNRIVFGIASDYSDLPNKNVVAISSIDTSPGIYWRVYMTNPVSHGAWPAGTPVGFMSTPSDTAMVRRGIRSINSTSLDWLVFSDWFCGSYDFNSIVSRRISVGVKYVRLAILVRGDAGTNSFAFLDDVRIEAFNPFDSGSRGLSMGVSSVFIAGDRAPLARVQGPGNIDRWRGTIYLEGF